MFNLIDVAVAQSSAPKPTVKRRRFQPVDGTFHNKTKDRRIEPARLTSSLLSDRTKLGHKKPVISRAQRLANRLSYRPYFLTAAERASRESMIDSIWNNATCMEEIPKVAPINEALHRKVLGKMLYTERAEAIRTLCSSYGARRKAVLSGSILMLRIWLRCYRLAETRAAVKSYRQ